MEEGGKPKMGCPRSQERKGSGRKAITYVICYQKVGDRGTSADPAVVATADISVPAGQKGQKPGGGGAGGGDRGSGEVREIS